MFLIDHLDENLVLFFDVKSKEDAISLLVDRLSDAHLIEDKREFYDAILDREAIISTGVGSGLAIPHAKLSKYDKFFIAIGIQKGSGIEWSSLDGSLVYLVVMIGGPDNRAADYLLILSDITKMLSNSLFRNRFFYLTTPREVIEVFKNYWTDGERWT